MTLYALDGEPPSPVETSTEIEVPVATQDEITVIPTEAISSRQVATIVDILTQSLILQPVQTAIESVTRLGQALVETTVTTVTYIIIDPNNPSIMTVTEYCATLSYEQPCSHCAHPSVPTVEMTIYVMPCDACCDRGENEATITAPCAAVTEPKMMLMPQDSTNAFVPTRGAYHAILGPVRTVTTSL